MYSFEECQTWRKKVSIRVEPTLYDRFKATIATRTHNKHRVSDILEDLMRGYVEKADNEEQSMPSDSKEDSLHRAIKTVDEPPITRSAVPTSVSQLLRGELLAAQIALTSKSMKLFEYCRSKFNDPNMNPSDFANAVIQVFFEDIGIKVVYVMDM